MRRSPNYFASLARYHVWATHRLLDDQPGAALSDDDWHRDCGLFFRSVHRTRQPPAGDRQHLVRALCRRQSPRMALDTELHTERDRAGARRWARRCTRWSRWLSTLDAGALRRRAGLHAQQRRAGAHSLRAGARPCLQPRDPPPRPAHRRAHRHGPARAPSSIGSICCNRRHKPHEHDIHHAGTADRRRGRAHLAQPARAAQRLRRRRDRAS